MRNISIKDLKIGEIITLQDGSVYKVDNVYEISNEYMKQHNLYHKNRITLSKVKGKGMEEVDFAITE